MRPAKREVKAPEKREEISRACPAARSFSGRMGEEKKRYACPCCGCRTFPVKAEEAPAFICPVCFWENDLFLSGEDEQSDENHGLTLREARENYRKIGACCPEMLPHVRPPEPAEAAPGEKTETGKGKNG